MDSSKPNGIESEFNMDLKSKERVHEMFRFLNRGALDPNLLVPETAFRIWSSIYRETKCIMKDDERAILEEKKKELTEIYNKLIRYKNQTRHILQVKAIGYSAQLNMGLDEFGLTMMDILQAHKYLYREAADIHKSVLRR